jgi:hypothetical protein
MKIKIIHIVKEMKIGDIVFKNEINISLFLLELNWEEKFLI